jgi:hypothetical protein
MNGKILKLQFETNLKILLEMKALCQIHASVGCL